MHGSQSETPARTVLWMGVFFFLYLFAAELARLMLGSLNIGFPLWAATGVGLAGIMLFGAGMWPAIALASLIFDFWSGLGLGSAVLFTAGSTFVPLLAAYLLRQFNFDPLLADVKDTLILFSVIFAVGWIVPAIYVGSMVFTHVISVSAFGMEFIPRWLGQILSFVVFGTLIIRWALPPFPRTKFEVFEALVSGAVLIFVCMFVFLTPYTLLDSIPLVYLILFPLLWISLRVGPRGMTLSLFITTIIALTGVAQGAQLNPAALSANLVQTEALLIALSILFLIFVSSEEGRKNALIASRSSVLELEEALAHISSEDQMKNQFIAVLAHELRNPLAAIRTSAEIAHMEIGQDERVRSMTGIIEDRVATMGRLLDDLLDISRISQKKLELKKERVPVAKAIERALGTAQPLIAGRGHAITIEAAPSLAVFADPVRLEQILVNLITNAAKYTSAGGHIWIRAWAEGTHTIAIAITDSGIGIPESMLGRIFEPFFQIKDSAYSNSGLGVGLSLTKQLVEMHGGSIMVESQESRGSTFTARLPASKLTLNQMPADDTTTFTHPPATDIESMNKNIHILIVDDNQVAAQGLRELLRMRGYEADVSYTGEHALAQVHERPPEAIILDIGLPGMSGYEVARTLRDEEKFSGAIVGLSGYGAEKDQQKSAASGFDRHLIKPVGLTEIEIVLNEVLAQKA